MVLRRLAIGLTLAGVVMVALALSLGQRSLALGWAAVRSALSVGSMVWLWATTPRLSFEDGCGGSA